MLHKTAIKQNKSQSLMEVLMERMRMLKDLQAGLAKQMSEKMGDLVEAVAATPDEGQAK
jgi:hypothetical protein